LSRNSNCHVTMEMLQTHCYATGTATLLWKRHQGPNMSQYTYQNKRDYFREQH
jgi:hypothetical protein